MSLIPTVDPWLDLTALEHETAQLLQTVRGQKPPKNQGGKENNQLEKSSSGSIKKLGSKKRSSQDDDAGTPTKPKANKKRVLRKTIETGGDIFTRKTALLELTMSLDGGFDKTRNLYSAGGGGTGTSTRPMNNRVTVEVLDDAGQDATPRGDTDTKRDKLRQELEATEVARFNKIKAEEDSIRSVQFQQERKRVTRADDTFVPAPTVSVHDVNRERSRLEKLEESARAKHHRLRNEVEERREYVQQDLAAVKVQALFRGAIGRQKHSLMKRLRDLEDTGTDWIEVRDRESGDMWFYNKKTGVSQWDRPADMQGQLSKNNQLKKLPPSAPSTAARGGGIPSGSSSSGAGGGLGAGDVDHGRGRGSTAPGGPRSFTAATTLPSLESLSRAKSAAAGPVPRASSASSSGGGMSHSRDRRVSFNNTLEVNSGTRTMAVEMPPLDATVPVRHGHSLGEGRSRPTSGGGGMNSTGGSTDTQVLSWEAEQERERAARKDVEKLMNLDKMMPPTNLLGPDGSFKPHLRTTVLDSLLATRFDSVSTVVGASDWVDANADPFEALKKTGGLTRPNTTGGRPFMKTKTALYTKAMKNDPSRRPMVAVCTLQKKYPLSAKTLGQRINIDQLQDVADDRAESPDKRRPASAHAASGSGSDALRAASDHLNIRDVEYPAVAVDGTLPQSTHAGLKEGQKEMCFGCWSAGGERTCQLHEENPPRKRQASESMLLCKNWELSVMRRRYRSEDIQEVFLKKKSSLRFIARLKKFLTVTEQKHHIYRAINHEIERSNFRFSTWMKLKKWMSSFADEFRMGRVRAKKSKERPRMLRDKRTMKSHTEVNNYFKKIFMHLPTPPITGFSWPERTGQEQYLFKHPDQVVGEDVELIFAEPIPIPQYLYQPRKYDLPLPMTIPMPRPEYGTEKETGGSDDIFNEARQIDVDCPAAWLERLCSAIAGGSIRTATMQINAVTPVRGIELLKRSKNPPAMGIKFATLARKPSPGNMAVGGLPMELLVYQLITTFVPSQYGALMVMDKALVSPGVSGEGAILFDSIAMVPGVQAFVLRAVEHPLNYRRAPTIILNSHIAQDDLSYYGFNRPEQTGEEDSHGFRTAAWCISLQPGDGRNPHAFIPHVEVASFNTPKPNISNTTHVNPTYPFCVPSTRDTTTLDFYHVLLNVNFSGAKPQIFTVLSTQECGKFMKKCRDDEPLGAMVASVYRSWAFVQKDTIQEFKTDDGIAYWYQRVTGQTFWERPLYEEEVEHPLKGGNRLDEGHDEEPSAMIRGTEGIQPRLNQGEFRKVQGSHHETDGEAMKRRKRVAALAPLDRDSGLIPGVGPQVAANAQSTMLGTVEAGGKSPVKTVSKYGSMMPAPSSLDTLSAYTLESERNERRAEGNPGVLQLTAQSGVGGRDDITSTQGILKWPGAFTTTADINHPDRPPASRPGSRPGSPAKASTSATVSGKRPILHGTLHNFDPDMTPTTREGSAMNLRNLEAGHPSPSPSRGYGLRPTTPSRASLWESERDSGKEGVTPRSPGRGGGAGGVDERLVSAITQSLGQVRLDDG